MRSARPSALLPLFISIAAIGYFLPWVITPASSLSLGAYDLAEWSSLHPLVKATAPFLWTALALRIPLAIVGIAFVTYVNKAFNHKSIAALFVIIIAIALLPPLEFFTIYRDDPNYIQQFVISIGTLITGFFVIFARPNMLRTNSIVVICVIGVVASVAGLYGAFELIRGFEVPAEIGAGGIITSIALALTAVLYITKQSS